MTNQEMEYFIRLAEYGSFTKAAKSLYISQPTLSRQIRNLEIELGVDLIDHSVKRPVRLTGPGEVFLKESRKIVGQINRIPDILINADRDRPSISIGYHSSFYNELLHQAVAECSQKYEDLVVNLKCCDSNTLNRGLRDGSFDVILIAEICMDDLPRTQKVALSEYEMCAAVSEKHTLANQKRVKLAGLSREKFIFLEKSLSTVSMESVMGYCMACGFSPRIVGWFQDKPTLLMAVGANVGISITLSGPEIPRTVRLVTLSEPYVRGKYYGIYSLDNKNPAIVDFLEILSRKYRSA